MTWRADVVSTMLTLFAIYAVLLLAWSLIPRRIGVQLVRDLLTDVDGPESVKS